MQALSESRAKIFSLARVVRSPNFLTVLLVIAGCVAIAVQNSHILIEVWTVPNGDDASNDILVTDAKHLALFHGNYSRVGFYHPGPFYFQWMALFEWLFLDTVPIFASPRAAQLFSIAFLHILAAGFYFRLWLVWSKSVFSAFIATLITIAVPLAMIGSNIVLSLWPPYMYLASALMTVTGFIGVAILGLSWLPLLVFGLCQLIHGHASFIGLGPIMVATATVATAVASRLPRTIWHPRGASAYLAARPTPFIVSAFIAALFVLPILAHTLIDWPAELPKYLAAANMRHSLRDALQYVLSFMPAMGVWALVFLLPPPATAGFGSPTKLRLTGLLALSSGGSAALFYAWRGIDTLSERYLVFWLLPFVGAALTAALFYFCAFLTRTWLRSVVLGTAALLALSAYRVITPVEPDIRSAELTSAAVDTLTKRAAPDTKIALHIDPESWVKTWPDAIALFALMNRRHQNFLCVESGSWHLLFHLRYRCAGSDKISEIFKVVAKDSSHPPLLTELNEAVIVPLRAPTVGSEIAMSHTSDHAFLLLGDWSTFEAWGIWSDGQQATLSFDASALPSTFSLVIKGRLFPQGPEPKQGVRVTDGAAHELAQINNLSGKPNFEIKLEIQTPTLSRMVNLTFEILHPLSPREIGINPDRRRLGLGLEQLKFEP